MSMKLTTQLGRSILCAYALMLGLSAAPASYAEQITFRFAGYVTSFSNSAALGGVALDDTITGTLTYDTSTVPDKTWGSWASTYTLQGGATSLTFMLGNGRLYEDTTLNARLVNGPVFPYASDDTFAINPVNLDASMYVRTGETQSLSLNFQNTSGVNGLSSAKLPSYIDIARLPFSGGTLYAFSGPAPTGEDVYVINRVLEAYQDSPYANGYGAGLMNQVTRYSRSNPNQPGYSFSLEESQAGGLYYPNPELARYKDWLAAGNQPMYLDSLTFQMTSISAVPEADSMLMLVVGLGVLGAALRRAK